MKLGRLNAGFNHVSLIETGEEPTNIDEGLSDAQLFKVDTTDDCYDQIIQFLAIGVTPKYFSTSQKKLLVVKALDFQLIARQLYKIGLDEILRRFVLPHEHEEILEEAHVGYVDGHYRGRAIVREVLCTWLWWPTFHNDVTCYAQSCDIVNTM